MRNATTLYRMALSATLLVLQACQGCNSAPSIQATPVVTELSLPMGLDIDSSGRICLVETGTGSVLVIENDGTRVVLASGFDEPTGMAFSPKGDLYVSCYGDGTVIKVNKQGEQSVLVDNIPGTEGIACDEAGNVYIASSENGSIIKVIPGQPAKTILTGLLSPRHAFAKGKHLYISCGDGIYIWNMDSKELIRAAIDWPAFEMACSPNGTIYAVNTLEGKLCRITEQGAVFSCNGSQGLWQVTGMAFDRDGALYAASSRGNILKLHPKAITSLTAEISSPSEG